VDDRLSQVLDPAYVAGIESMSTDEVRARRRECTEVETALSYVRRLAQGHLDILVADLQRRAVGDASPEVSDMVNQLSGILSSGPSRSPGAGRLPTILAPDLDEAMIGELEAALADLTIGDLASMSDAEAIALGERLRDFQRHRHTAAAELGLRCVELAEDVVRAHANFAGDPVAVHPAQCDEFALA